MDKQLVPALVVILDAVIRQLVGWIVQEMDVTATLTPTWRDTIVAMTRPPADIVADPDNARA